MASQLHSDVLSSRDYPEKWLEGKVLLGNEFDLVKVFLTCNQDFEAIAAATLPRFPNFVI